MHYLKLVKEGTIEDFMKSDESKFPCVCCYSESHPNYSAQQDAVIAKSKPVPLGTFIIDNVTYYGEYNMTWEQWINSKYNTGNFDSVICTNSLCSTSHTFIKLGNKYVVDFNGEGVHGEYIILSNYDEENHFRLAPSPAPCM
jgi:hypothetical protein